MCYTSQHVWFFRVSLFPRELSLEDFLLTSLGYFGTVVLSDYYDLPFNDILDWQKFSVILKEHDVYRLKQILKDITQEQFVALHNNLVKVKVFLWPDLSASSIQG